MALSRTMSWYFLITVLACETFAQSPLSPVAANQNAAGAQISSSGSRSKTSGGSAAVKTSSSRRRRTSSAPVPNQGSSSPQISYVNGQLTVLANNATLSDVLKAIQNATGAKIEGVAPAESERVFGEFGPGSPQVVCSKLLTGSHYDFILMGAPENPNVIERIILTERSTELATSPAAAQQPTQVDGTNDDQEMDAAGNNQVETPNQVPMTPEQQILPPPADSAQSQPATEAQPAGQVPTRPQHWGVLSHPVPSPTPEPTPAPPH